MKEIPFVFDALLRQMLSLNSDFSMDKFTALAKKTMDFYFRKISDNTELMINTFILVVLAIDKSRNKYVGRDKASDRVNFLAWLIAKDLAPKLAGSLPTQNKILRLAESYNYQSQNYLGIKLFFLYNQVLLINKTVSYYDNLSIDLKVFLSEQTLKSTADNVFQELLELRRYGIKNSYFEDHVLVQKGDYLIISSITSMYDSIIATNSTAKGSLEKTIKWKDDNLMAIINISPYKEMIKSNEKFDDNKDGLPYGMGVVSNALLSIDWQGELGVSGSDLKDFFYESGRGELYEIVRANLIFRLYDLLVPTIIRKKYSLPEDKKVPTIKRLLGVKSEADPLLYLKRIRILWENRVEIRDEIIAEAITDQENKLTRCGHDVVCYIRRLPEGYKASARARELAKQILKYDLKDGETFVSEHIGTEKQKLHKAVLR